MISIIQGGFVTYLKDNYKSNQLIVRLSVSSSFCSFFRKNDEKDHSFWKYRNHKWTWFAELEIIQHQTFIWFTPLEFIGFLSKYASTFHKKRRIDLLQSPAFLPRLFYPFIYIKDYSKYGSEDHIWCRPKHFRRIIKILQISAFIRLSSLQTCFEFMVLIASRNHLKKWRDFKLCQNSFGLQKWNNSFFRVSIKSQ